MSTIYAQRSSAVRAAKKACGPDQEWVIMSSGEGYIYTLMDVEAAQPKVTIESLDKADAALSAMATRLENFNHNTSEGRQEAAIALGKKLAVTEPANRMAVVDEFNKVRPFQQAKLIIGELVSKGVTARKELIAACVAQGIKLNTADNAHYEMCVRKS